MFYYKVAFVVYVGFFLWSLLGLAAARKSKDVRQFRPLGFLTVGLGLSACCFLCRILDGFPAEQISVRALFFCTTGAISIWVGWVDHWNARYQWLKEQTQAITPCEFKNYPSERPHLDTDAERILHFAQEEARQWRQPHVSSEHLLLGLINKPINSGSLIIGRLGGQCDRLHYAITTPLIRTYPSRPTFIISEDKVLPFTESLQQVMTFASQEAHRFDSPTIGPEHLLLGLVLMGREPAALALYQEGITVDGIRQEIITSTRLDRMMARSR